MIKNILILVWLVIVELWQVIRVIKGKEVDEFMVIIIGFAIGVLIASIIRGI